MKKILFCIFGVMIFMLSTKAYYITPANGTMQKGGSKTISIFALPPMTGEPSVVSIKMTLVNATVTSFTPGSGIISSPGTCAGGASFLPTEICVDIGVSSIQNNQLLGTFNVTWANTTGTATITKDTTSKYYQSITTGGSAVVTASLGTAGTYTLGTIPATPFTPDLLPEIFLATGGLGMMFIGIYLFQYLKDEEKDFQEEIAY